MESIKDEWNKFCDELKDLGKLIEKNSHNDHDHYEGYRYLLRLLRLSSEMYFEHSDNNHPSFYCLSHETGKIGADNPDNHYLNANINGKNLYTIMGNIGEADYISFGVKENRYSIDGTMISHDEIDLKNVDVDKNGNFSISMNESSGKRNHLTLRPSSNMVIVRQTYKNKMLDARASMRIRSLNDYNPSLPLTNKEFINYLSSSIRFIRGTAQTFTEWVKIFQKDHLNALPLGDQVFFQAAGGDPNISYHHGYYDFKEDECLKITTKIPQCSYWNFQLENHWMESLDYRNYPIHLNYHNAVTKNNNLKIHITYQPENLENNLITCGRPNGAMLLRWIDADESIEPIVELVKIKELT